MEDFRELKGKFGRHVSYRKQKYLYFSGTTYLGLSQNKTFLGHYLKGLKKFGINNGTSRANTVQLGIYEEAERYASAYFGADDCAIVSSGYLASHLAVKTFENPNTIYAPQTHPSLWLKGKPNNSSDFKNWLQQTIITINSSTVVDWVLVSNAMQNLYPEIYDFSLLGNIVPEKKVTLILDDSHGIGINNNGKSALDAAPKAGNIEVIVVASMAKALGIDAGIILSSSKIIDQIKQNEVFIGASPPAAAGLYAFMRSKTIYQNALERVQGNMNHFVQNVKQRDEWHFEINFPVFSTQNADIYRKLKAQKILISAFPYPDRNSEPIHRVVLSSWHTKRDINTLIKSL